MPPKKKPNEPGKKADQKKKEKIIEDKTFGLKNKKGAKNQKFIQQVQHQVKFGNQSGRKVEQLKQVGKKDEKKKEAEELNQIFKPVTTQKVEKGIDPKSVLCAFYKQGQCKKGDKCKFSHDVSIERKSEKKNIYFDVRDEDSMENWDEAKLKEVVETKHGEADKKKPPTNIVSYGWFWDCPNGGDKCHYRHALPPGFVLNKDKKKNQEKKDDISLEDLVEKERAALGSNLCKITFETFLAWKKKKIQDKKEKAQVEQDRKKAEFKAGHHIGLSGREMFTFNPELALEVQMDEDEAAYDLLPREDDENSELYVEITAEALSLQAQQFQNVGTTSPNNFHEVNRRKERLDGEEEKLPEAVGGEDNIAATIGEEAIPIDENLFDEDDEDLEELEEDLERLDVE
ncbi:zinc finger CCCH domain-containing protein 15-like [Limulus polyphemus]|uniref:Zinc finger CCCH domain-containing protein 15-like n=1 Tax=Limulus polyphemus TaxID=6850 RepID=A0ABM1BHZ7_LIMPO|nr:zinc finger CCCH domain-containing protein 15-like [Limulus polyphemus]